MARIVIVRGRLSNPRHIELEEPVNDLTGAVQIVIRPVAELDAGGVATPGFIGLCADLGGPPSPEDIDEARREMWASFPHDDGG